MKACIGFLKKQPLITGLICLVLSVVTVRMVDTYGGLSPQGMVIRMLLTVECAAFLFLISREKVFEHADNQTGYALRKLSRLLILPAVLGIMGLLQAFRNPPAEHLGLRLAYSLTELLFVGLFEELCFRAVLNDAMLYRFREKKGIFVWIAVVSSLIFGAVHMLGSDVGSGMAIAQAVLKTIATALFGFAILIVYWKTHNIWACALIHSLNDLLTSFSDMIFPSAAAAEERQYVLEGVLQAGDETFDLGFIAVGTYLVQIVFGVVIVLSLRKVLKSIDFEQIRREW